MNIILHCSSTISNEAKINNHLFKTNFLYSVQSFLPFERLQAFKTMQIFRIKVAIDSLCNRLSIASTGTVIPKLSRTDMFFKNANIVSALFRQMQDLLTYRRSGNNVLQSKL